MLIVLLFALPFGGTASAQSPPVQVSSSVDRSQITIGDLIEYRVVVDRAPEVEVFWPSLGSNLGAFEIRDYQVAEPQKKEGRILEQVRYTISTFDTGAFVIPPVIIRYRVPPDTVQQQLQTEAIHIYVASLKPSLEGDIRGLKPQAVPPRNWRRFILYMGLALAVLLLAIGGWMYWRYRKRGALPFVRTEPPRPPHEIALERLRQLEEEKLYEQGEVKEHFSRLSEILRAYIEDRYYVPALESTTYEIVEWFSRDGQLGGHLQSLEEILSVCDLVKFARHLPDVETKEHTLKLSYAFIEATKPIFVSEESDGSDESAQSAQGASVETAPRSDADEVKST